MATKQNTPTSNGTPDEALSTYYGVPVLERVGLRRLGEIRTRMEPLDEIAAAALRTVVNAYKLPRYTDDHEAAARAAAKSRSRPEARAAEEGERSELTEEERKRLEVDSESEMTAAERKKAEAERKKAERQRKAQEKLVASGEIPDPARRGPAAEAADYIASKGLQDEFDQVTDRLNRTGMSDIARLLLAQEEIYGTLILKALKKERVDSEDVSALVQSIKRNAEDEPRLFFEGALVQKVFERNHIEIPHKDSPKASQYEQILRRIHEEGISLYSGTIEERVLDLQQDVAADGNIPAYVNSWLRAQGIDSAQATPRVRSSMIASLKRLNVPFTDSGMKRGQFNQYFAVAYDQAKRSGSAETSDPISLTRPQGTFSSWDFQVDTFDAAEEQGIVPENIRAAGALDYVYFLGDLLGVYKITDALVLRWAAGIVDIQDADTSSRLYRYWQLRDDRLSPEERGMLYKRVLSKGDAELLSKMVGNDAFPGLWHSLMTAVADYTRDMTDASKDGAVSRIPIYRATQALQYNLSEYMAGMAPMQVTDMYFQLRDAFDILSAPEIVTQLSSGRSRGMWSVIDRIGKEELGQSVDVGTVRALAVQGNKVFQWIADFERGMVNDAQFDQMREAAEAWIIAASGAEGALSPHEPAEDEEEEDEYGSDSDFGDEGEFDEDPNAAW